MQIILRGPAAGYEAEHTARLFFPEAEKTENLPQESDFVLAQSHLCTDTILLQDKQTLDRMWILRKYLADMNPIEAMDFVKDRLEKTKDNDEFLMSMNS